MSGEAAPPAPRAAPPQLGALTGVRFFAALAVVVFHCTQWRTWSVPEAVRNVARSGFVAVGFFFVLSGFILAYTHRGDTSRRAGRRAFYVSRLARIYPVYALGLALAAPFFVASHLRAHTPGRLALEGASVLGLVQAHVPTLAMVWNPPAWSLSAEAFFYLLFPFVAPPILSARPRRALAVAAAAYAAAITPPLVYLAVSPDGVAVPSHETPGFWLDAIKFGPLFRLPEFALGIALGRLYLDEPSRARIARYGAWVAPLAVAALLAVLASSPHVPYPLLHNGVLAPLFALVILALAAGGGALGAALASPVAVLLGEASYALYILHLPLVILVRKVCEATVGVAFTRGAGFTAVYFAVAIGASIASYRWVEVPLRARIRSLVR